MHGKPFLDYICDIKNGNGTVTESCMPYSSGNKIVEECITKCKNNEEMKLFYSEDIQMGIC